MNWQRGPVQVASLHLNCIEDTTKDKMKGFAFALVVLCVVVLVEASPAKSSRPVCDFVCGQEYSPVCGAPPNDNTTKPRLFGSSCALDSHNCEHKSNWVKVSMDRCKNVGGIRLS